MLFTLITLAGLLGVVFWLSFIRFAADRTAGSKAAKPYSLPAYWSWARRSVRTSLTADSTRKTRAVLSQWAEAHYPGWTIGIVAALALGLVYQVASGFIFAIFIPRGLFGFPLLVHVMSGGLFAVALVGLILARGRMFRPDPAAPWPIESPPRPTFKKLEEASLRKIIFWAFAFFGLIQVTTALGSMLPVFPYDAQEVFISVHRLGALGILLTSVVFVDLTFIARRRP